MQISLSFPESQTIGVFTKCIMSKIEYIARGSNKLIEFILMN